MLGLLLVSACMGGQAPLEIGKSDVDQEVGGQGGAGLGSQAEIAEEVPQEVMKESPQERPEERPGGRGGSGGMAGTTEPDDSDRNRQPCASCGCGKVDAVAALADGLVGYWRFDEGAGIVLEDSSGGGARAVLVEGGTSASPDHVDPSWTADRGSGHAIHLDGIDDWARIDAPKTMKRLVVNNAVSVTAWVWADRYSSPKDGGDNIVSWQEGGTRLHHFGLGLWQGLPSAKIHFFQAVGPENLPLGEWHHMTLTYDGITVRVYVDAQEVASLDVGWPLSEDTTPLAIGATMAEQDVINHWPGKIDEVRIYDRELTPCEVAEITSQR